MYDFYGNPPKTKKDLHDWLTSWLEKVDAAPVEHEGQTYVQEYGFRRGFCMHCVFRNLTTNEYVWWVFPDEQVGKMESFPNARYPSFDDMLKHVIDDYYARWKLTE